MATYSIVTNREQEIGLNYAFDAYGTEGQTKAQFLQVRVSHQVLDPMFVEYQNAQAISLEKSIATIPDENEAKAKSEIEAVILDNGGTLVPANPPPPPPPGV